MFVSRSEFAAQQGWSPSYVTKLGHQGRLVLDDGGKRVNVPETLARLRRTEDPVKESVRQYHLAARIEKHVHAQILPGAQDVDDGPGAPAVTAPAVSNGPGAIVADDPKYWGNKARREGALAELAELDLARKRGELVERAQVEAASYASARMLRDTLLGLPVQLAPGFAACADAFEIQRRMDDALRQVLTDAAKMTADDLQRVGTEPH